MHSIVFSPWEKSSKDKKGIRYNRSKENQVQKQNINPRDVEHPHKETKLLRIFTRKRKEPYKVLLLQEDGTQTTLMQILLRISKGMVEGAA